MTPAELDRQDELNLLEQLLRERHRPIPPAPRIQHTRRLIADLMLLVAQALTEPAEAA